MYADASTCDETHADVILSPLMKRLWVKLAVVAAILIGLGWGLRLLGIDLTYITPERVRTFVLSFGVWAPTIYLLLYAQPIVPVPASLMTIAAGLAFGSLWGILAGLTGATTRACLQFAIARRLGREMVAKMLKGRIASLDQQIGNNGFRAVLLIRLIPNFPFDIQNYGLGFSRVKFLPFATATFLGMVPGTFAFVYFGYSLTDPKQLWKLLLAIVIVVAIMFLPRLWKRRLPATPE